MSPPALAITSDVTDHTVRAENCTNNNNDYNIVIQNAVSKENFKALNRTFSQLPFTEILDDIISRHTTSKGLAFIKFDTRVFINMHRIISGM